MAVCGKIFYSNGIVINSKKYLYGYIKNIFSWLLDDHYLRKLKRLWLSKKKEFKKYGVDLSK